MKEEIIKDVALFSKANIEKICTDVINRVEEGELNPLAVEILCAALEKAIKNIRSHVSDEALSEAYKFGEKKFKAYGCEVSIRDVGVKYDYSVSSEWSRLNEEKETLNEKMKSLETRMKAASENSIFYDADGTEISFVPRTSKESVTVTFK
ncbi:MAG: hypothetical protein MJZ98_00460 [Paludibacteraceae bacterium]|nr:hypothetical protein [Paludibacteraceae bacterium]